MQSSEDDEVEFVQRRQGESDEHYLTRMAGISAPHDDPLAFVISYSQQLNLSLAVAIIAMNIAGGAETLTALDRHPRKSIAAAAIYISSYLFNQRRSLADIAFLACASEPHIHSVYRDMESGLTDEDWSQIFDGRIVADFPGTLPSSQMPPLELDSTDGEEEDGDGGPSLLGNLGLVKELCFGFYRERDPDNLIGVMAQKVAEKMDGLRLDWKTANPWILAAACTYMASHLVFQGKTFEEASAVSGVSSASIRTTYEVMFVVREPIVQEEWFETLFWTRENVLYCLPEP